jgi:hypothetical protein
VGQTLERLQGALASLGWVQRGKRAVRRQDVQEGQQCRDGVLEGLVQGQHLLGHLRPDRAWAVALLNVGIPLESGMHSPYQPLRGVAHRS